MITLSKDQSDFLKREDTTISAKDDMSSRSILGEEITYEVKERSVIQKPYITSISKSQMVIGNYYKATINIYGQAKYGTTVYANIGSQESSQKIGSDQTFGFTVDTIRQSITIEFYAIDSNGSKSESVFVTCTPNGDYITGNGTYPTNNQFEYTVYGDSVTIEGYNGDKSDLVIPDEIEGYPVKSIAWGAFDKNQKITTVKIPSTVTEISANAFRDCINLTSVNIPEGVKVLTGGVFNNCKSLKSIKIPKSVTTLEVYSFNNCSSLTEVEIPENVTFIGYNSFTGCTNLSKIIIPKSVTTIEANTFTKNDILTIYGYKNSAAETYAKKEGIKFKYMDVNSSPVITSSDKVFNLGTSISNNDLLKDVKAYDEEDGDLTLKVIVKSHNINSNLVGTYKVIYKVTDSTGQTTEKENKVQIINPNLNKEFEYELSGGSVTIEGYNGNKADVVIPDKIEGYPVESIAYGAFKDNKNIVSITIPNGITQLNGYTFSGCTNLETVKLPDSLIYIYDNVFSNCTKLKNINIPSKVKLIYVYAFYKCSSLEKIDLPDSIEEIGYSAFSDCFKLKSIKIPSKIKILKNYVFSGCKSLTEVEIPNGVSTIEHCAFYGCDNLNKVTVPKSVNFIGDSVFFNCAQSLKIYGYKNSYIEQYANDRGLTFVYIKETNTLPTITANNLTVDLGEKINLMDNVSANDKEDGDITSKIKIVENTVDTTKVGKYKVVYSVEDSDGNIVKKEITVTVNAQKIENVKAASASYNSNKITWNKVSGANGYVVYRSTSKNGTYKAIKTITNGNTLSYTNSSLATGTTYYYKVRAYRTVDGKRVYSKYSSVVSAKPVLSKTSVTLTAGTKKATVKWKKISGASGYEVYRANSKSGKYTNVKTITKGSIVSYTNNSLTNKKTYYYKVRAYRLVNGKKVYSSYSSIKSVKIK